MRAEHLELSLSSDGDDQYIVDARFRPLDTIERQLLDHPLPRILLDVERLELLSLDLDAYAQAVTEMLFSDTRVRNAFITARDHAEQANLPLRLNLRLQMTDTLVHAVHWELLLDPERGTALCTSERVLFSRLITSHDMTPLSLPPLRSMRALVVIANPEVSAYRLAPIDVEAELARCEQALFGMSKTLVSREIHGRPATIEQITDHLSEGYDILYLVCHGTSLQGETYLFFEDDEGKLRRVRGSHFADQIAGLKRRPAMIVLIACRSATADRERGALAALGPLLARAGVPAVIAMQADFSMASASTFTTRLLSEIRTEGIIDEGVAVARRQITGRADWWVPVLFLRVADGRVWQLEPSRSIATPVADIDQKNRRQLLSNVRQFWVEDVYKKSLHGASMIELGMSYDPQAVHFPWESVLANPNMDLTPIAPNIRLIDIFDKANEKLLLLGEPGSGKTTMLITLADALLERAERDTQANIPVILNLASWALKRLPFADWIVEELEKRYRVPRQVGSAWIDANCLALLLDGLDEVVEGLRAECVAAINAFVATRQVPIVVCCRVQEYYRLDLANRLQLQDAVLVRELDDSQIQKYLTRVGRRLAGLRAALEREETLRELAKIPLFLNVMTLVYQDRSSEDVIVKKDPDEQRAYLFELYIQRMLREKGAKSPYYKHPERTRALLAWLADRLQWHNSTEFMVEGLQPSWLPSMNWVWIYAIATRITSGLIIGLSLGLGLFAASVFEYFVLSLVAGGAVGLLDGYRLYLTREAQPERRLPAFVRILGIWLVIGIILGIFFGLVKDAPESDKIAGTFAVTGVNLGSFVGLFFGFLFGLRGSRQWFKEDVKPVERLRVSSQDALQGSMRYGLGFAIVCIVMAGLVWLSEGRGANWVRDTNEQVFGWLYASTGLTNEFAQFLIFGALLGFLFGAVFGSMIEGVKQGIVDEELKRLNQGLRISARYALITVFLFGAVYGAFFSILLGALSGFNAATMPSVIQSSLVTGLCFGLTAALWNGGFDIIQHYGLRLILFGTGRLPSLAYADFLDYASDCILLKRAGGTYLFYHRFLQEQFARQSPMTVQNLSPNWRKLAGWSTLAVVSPLLVVLALNAFADDITYAMQRPPQPGAEVHRLAIGDNIDSPDGIHCDDICFDQGDRLFVQAGWRMSTGHFVTWVSPEGTDAGFLGFPIGTVWHIPNVPEGTLHGALMCRISGETEWQRCGSSYEFTANRNGCLEFMINGIEYQKYLGNYYVSVQVYRN